MDEAAPADELRHIGWRRSVLNRVQWEFLLNFTGQVGQDAVSQANREQSLLEADLSSTVLRSLSGRDADRERRVAMRTRRVVAGSLGVIRNQRQQGMRARAVAVGVGFVLLLLITPLVWEATDSLVAGEHLTDPGSQLSLWACILCPTILGAALIAGWWRQRS